jgi:hypothetical protein
MLAKCVQRSMHLTPVYFLPLGGGCSQPGIGDRLNRDSLGYKFIEQFPAMSRGSTVESKSEFVEIGVQLLMGQCTLMGTHQPAVQHRGHPVHTGQQCRRGFAAGIDQAWSVLETFLLQSWVGLPSICDDHGARFNHLFHEGDERALSGRGNPTQADASDPLPVNLHRDRHQGLASHVPTASSSLNAIHICFVDFNLASEPVSARPYHGVLQFLQPQPRCPVTAKAKEAL